MPRSAWLLSTLLLSFPAVAQAQEGGLEVTKGRTFLVSVPLVQSVTAVDPSIASPIVNGPNKILVTGVRPGQTTLEVTLQNGARQELLVVVKADEPEAAEELAIKLEKGELKTLKAKGITGLELGDPKVLDATLKNGKLNLRALEPGRCDVRLLRKGGPAMLVVEVTAPRTTLTLSGVELHVGQSLTVLLDGSIQAVSKSSRDLEAKVDRPGRVTLRGLAPSRGDVEVTLNGTTVTLPVEVLK